MKKRLFIVLILCFCLVLIGCKSKEAKKAEDLIQKIGIVSSESGKAIEEAEFYYNMLSDKQKSQVENADILVQARQEYDELMSKAFVPVLLKKSEDEVKEILEEAGFEYEIVYDWDIYEEHEKGCVMTADPVGGLEYDKDTFFKVTISKGPYYISCKNATLSWYSVGKQEDEWTFNVYSIAETGELFLVADATFFENFEWRSTGYGEVSLTKDFDKSVPVTIDYHDQSVKKGESQHLEIKAPIKNLGDERPTNAYFKLFIDQGGVHKEIIIYLSIAWE